MKKEREESDFGTSYSKYYRLTNHDKRKIWSDSNDKIHFHSEDELRTLKEVEQRARIDDPNWRIETDYYFKPIKI